MANESKRRLWITYARSDDAGGDFSYLVQELKKVDVEATYDRIELVVGRSIWEQIGDRILKGPIDGWAYLITPKSLESAGCREELDYALNRALETRGRDFPLIGLLHDVLPADLPAPLKVRLCVNLADPIWMEQVRAGLEGRPPIAPGAETSRFVWRKYENYRGTGLKAVEVRPRFGEIMSWTFLLPVDVAVKRWGHGPAEQGEIAGTHTDYEDGEGPDIRGIATKTYGAGDKLSASVSAYVLFSGAWPQFLALGLPADSTGRSYVEIYTPR